MNRLLFLAASLALASNGYAQYLRAGAHAHISSLSGNASQTRETPWAIATAGSWASRTAAVSNVAGSASSTFESTFGHLRGSTSAHLSTVGSAFASATGTFGDFTNFVGASSYDTITLAGPGEVRLRLTYHLHTINQDPNDSTVVDTKFKIDTFSTALGNRNMPAFSHVGAGNLTSTNWFEIVGVAGQKFDLLLALSSFSAVDLGSGVAGTHTASSDFMSTAMLSIEPISGSFTSASGAGYAPVPEPASLAALSIGALALIRRRRKQA